MAPEELRKVLSDWGPLIGGVGAFALPFLYTIVKDARTRRIEAQKPHLERQLKLYTEACQVTVCLATSSEQGKKEEAAKRFWELYWGELCMVEDRGVEQAMAKFGEALNGNVEQEALKDSCYDLAHAFRKSLEKTWGHRILPY